MAFYKKCACGEKTYFEHRGMAPRECAFCRRSLIGVSVTDEENEQQTESEVQAAAECDIAPETAVAQEGFYFTLDAEDGSGFVTVPKCEGIVGRAYLGAELFKDHSAISREHMHVMAPSRLGVRVIDTSRYGTFINGVRLIKGEGKIARAGDVIKLYDLSLKVSLHDGGKQNES